MSELIIFDCDGVLVDSERLAVQVEVRVLAELGWPLTREEVITRFVGRSASYMREQIEQHIGRTINWRTEFENRYDEAFARELVPVEGIRDALERIDSPICVASSGTHRRIHSSLLLTGLHGFFENRIFSVEDVARGKPAPDLFLHAAARMGVRPDQCVVIEDSPAGVEAAHAASMTAFAYLGGIVPTNRFDRFKVVAFDDMRELPNLLDDVRRLS